MCVQQLDIELMAWVSSLHQVCCLFQTWSSAMLPFAHCALNPNQWPARCPGEESDGRPKVPQACHGISWLKTYFPAGVSGSGRALVLRPVQAHGRQVASKPEHWGSQCHVAKAHGIVSLGKNFGVFALASHKQPAFVPLNWTKAHIHLPQVGNQSSSERLVPTQQH